MIQNKNCLINNFSNKNSFFLFLLFLNKKNKCELGINKKNSLFKTKHWKKSFLILCKNKKSYKSLVSFKSLLLKNNKLKTKNNFITVKFDKSKKKINFKLVFKFFKQVSANLYIINLNNNIVNPHLFKFENTKMSLILSKIKENYSFSEFTFNNNFFYYENLIDYRFYFSDNYNDSLNLNLKSINCFKKKDFFFNVLYEFNLFNKITFYFFDKKSIFYNFNFFSYQNKKNYDFFEWKEDFNYFLNYLIAINDRNILIGSKINYNFVSNNLLKNLFNILDSDKRQLFVSPDKKRSHSCFNNYYPVSFTNKITYRKFFSNFKNNYNLDFVSFTNKFVLSFLEKNFKKYIYVKYVNNYYNDLENQYLNSIIFDYKNFQPAYWKSFLVKDFIYILWYSFFLKDMTMISTWISIFMEKMHFKNHKKFLSFFSNFINKYSDIFINVLKIKGFFFDIRGKVGVTGSSKKRHLFFMFGSVNKSSKKSKINFNQSLVRTYSGVMGLTYIINY